MKIGGLMKLTLLDYPEKVACTVFTVGCNFRCPFCHNSLLVTPQELELYSESEILDFLSKRSSVLEGMCLTGGEPLLQQDVDGFLAKVKALGYQVKLDTNGSFPDKLMSLVKNKLVDYVAMDVKNSLSRYDQIAGCKVDVDSIVQSINFLKTGVVPYEFRTTVTGNYHNEQSIESIGQLLQGADKWYLQMFVDSGHLIDKSTTGCDEQTMTKYLQIARKYVPNAQIRGMK